MRYAATRHRAPVIVLAACVAAALPRAPALAQGGAPAQAPGPLTLQVRPWLDGWFDTGQWVALDATTRNAAAGLDAELLSTAGTASQWTVPVELPSGAEKHVPLLIRPDADYAEVSLQLQGGGARPAASQRVLLRRTRDQQLVAVVGGAGRRLPGLDAFALAGGQAIKVDEPVESLPESSLAMGSVDAMVLAQPDLSRLTEAQREALRQWVGLGGTVVVLGGPGLPPVLEGLPEPLRPATTAGTTRVADLGAALAGWYGTTWKGGDVSVAALEPADGAEVVVAADDGATPLILRRPYGAGNVWLLAFDPSEPPVSQWGELEALWHPVVEARGPSTWSEPPVDFGQLAGGLEESEAQPLPSMGWAILLLVGYIILVGPANYLYLRRRRRLDLAWVTIPSLTLLATLVTYGVGVAMHGRDLVTRQLSVVRVVPGAEIARVTTLVSLFSPASRTYDIHLPGAYAFAVPGSVPASTRSETALRAVQAPVQGVDELRVDQWSASTFAAEAVVPWPAGSASQLTSSGMDVSGTVGNPFGRAADGAQLVLPGRAQWVGQLGSGANIKINPGPVESSVVVNVSGPDYEGGPAQSALFVSALGFGEDSNAWGSYPTYGGGQPSTRARTGQDVVVFGFTTEAPVPAQVQGAMASAKTHSLLYARLPLGTVRHVEVPGLISEGGSEAMTEACGAGGAFFDEADKPVTFAFPAAALKRLPAGETWWVEVEPPEGIQQLIDSPPEGMDPMEALVNGIDMRGRFGADTWIPLSAEAGRYRLPPSERVTEQLAGDDAFDVRLEAYPLMQEVEQSGTGYIGQSKRCWRLRITADAPVAAEVAP